MDVKLSIGGENIGMNTSIGEIEEDEGGAPMESLKDKMDPSKDEEIWRSRRERMSKALAAVRTTDGQDQAKTDAAARRLAEVIEGADVEEFIRTIERDADQTDLSAIFDLLGVWSGSLLHIAAATGKDDILKLLLDYVGDHVLAAQNELGDTSLHVAAKVGGLGPARMLIRRAIETSNVKDNNWIPRIKNKVGNTALHEAVLNNHVDVVFLLLGVDPEPVYWKNMADKSPLYLALDVEDPAIRGILFFQDLEPSKIQGLPPIHGVIVRGYHGLANKILEQNVKLFAMTDSKGGNVFHLAAYWNLGLKPYLPLSETEYLARERDKNGDLPIHIAAKMGHVDLIKKLIPISNLRNGQGQTVLHVAAKYGRALALRQMLRDPELGKQINAVDHAGNTPLHLAAMHSQPAALIHLLLDKRIQLAICNNNCSTALDLAAECIQRGQTIRNQLSFLVLLHSSLWLPHVMQSGDLIIHRPEARDNRLLGPIKKKPGWKTTKDSINIRMVVATLVATVTFAAGFAVPGGFNSSDTASRDDRGMATMLDRRLFQAFAICNTIAMFCSMTAVINLNLVRPDDAEGAVTADGNSVMALAIALPAMSVAFLTGVTLTLRELPWLANTIFYLGLVCLLIFATTYMRLFNFVFSICGWNRRLMFWLILAHIYLWGVETVIFDDAEDDGMASKTSASRPADSAGQSSTE